MGSFTAALAQARTELPLEKKLGEALLRLPRCARTRSE
jgi:hypothetical protein